MLMRLEIMMAKGEGVRRRIHGRLGGRGRRGLKVVKMSWERMIRDGEARGGKYKR
jgi:hypothetical protein